MKIALFQMEGNTAVKESIMKYLKPHITNSCKVALVVRSADNAKPGIQSDGVRATGTAYEADE